MNKSNDQLHKRAKFVRLAITDKKQAADKLRAMANGIEYCRTLNDVFFALSEILYLSERTISRDFKR